MALLIRLLLLLYLDKCEFFGFTFVVHAHANMNETDYHSNIIDASFLKSSKNWSKEA